MTDIKNIKLIVFDVDGVLTDGAIIVNDHGVESKHFHVRDGFAMRHAERVGLRVAVMTGRMSRTVNLRMAELQIALLQQGAKDKGVGLETICQKADVGPEETAYVGDDLIDLPALLRCGYPIAVADAVEEVRSVALYVTETPGGHGAAREAIEHILRAQGKWEEVVEGYGL